ncbi:MAG TPA: hypothetical protein PKN83_18000 [Leptospiraceae bacterium]|nr:hypothetical protein [Leptospiraceae bacterium]
MQVHIIKLFYFFLISILYSIYFLLFLNCLKAKKSPFDMRNSSTTSIVASLSNRPTVSNTTTSSPQSGNISLGARTYTQVTINLTPPSGMNGTINYRIYASYPDEWTTIDQVEANAVLKLDYTTNISAYTISGLEPYQFYRVDIIAKDSNGNKLLYTPFCIQMDPNISGTVTCSTGPKGIVTTLTGTGGLGSADGSFSTSTFNQPQGIVALGNSLYVVDTSNNRIRKLDMNNQTVSTIAGSTLGYTNAIGLSAQFNSPTGITTDGTNLFIVDRNNYSIRLLNLSNLTVTTFAGPATATLGYTDGTSSAARFNAANYIIYNGSDFYLSDEDNCRIRKITTSALVTTHAGSTCPGTNNGLLLSASFSQDIVGITFYQSYIFLTDKGNNNIRKIDTSISGNVSTFTNMTDPHATVVYGKYLYVSENTGHRIYKYDIDTGIGSVFVGSGSSGSSDGTGTNASFNLPRAMTFIGNVLYVADTNNHKIRKIE